MLNKLHRYRVHLIFGAATLGWFFLMVMAGMIDGQRFFPALWAAIKEVRPFEWLVVICLWLSMASLMKEQHKNARNTSLG